MRTRWLSLAVLFALLGVGVASADPIAVLPGVGGFQNNLYNSDVSIGWQFVLSSPIRVTQLGFFDAGGNGLFDPHPVGIFSRSGALLVSTTVAGGTSGALENGFRFAPVAPTRLGVGAYTIAAFGNSTSLDEFRFGTSGSRAIPGLSIGAGVQSAFGHPSLTFADQVNAFAEQGYFGPNFTVEAAGAPTPEPASLILALSGALVLLYRRGWVNLQ
jgi:hypothetical protein